MGIFVGKRLGIYTRKDMSNIGANNDADDGDRNDSGWNQGDWKNQCCISSAANPLRALMKGKSHAGHDDRERRRTY